MAYDIDVKSPKTPGGKYFVKLRERRASSQWLNRFRLVHRIVLQDTVADYCKIPLDFVDPAKFTIPETRLTSDSPPLVMSGHNFGASVEFLIQNTFGRIVFEYLYMETSGALRGDDRSNPLSFLDAVVITPFLYLELETDAVIVKALAGELELVE